jgi:uncharacterized protein YaiI (UPF0178 family)
LRIWIDADACPKPIKEILFRAADRTKTVVVLVSNQPLSAPLSLFIQKIQVPSGFDVADKKILDSMEKGDLVITADILLANAVVDKEGTVLDPRGKLYTPRNMKQHLSIRNFNTDLRSAGVLMGGPSSLSKKEIEVFCNHLDKYLTKQ